MSELTRMVKIGEIEYSAQNEVADEIDALREKLAERDARIAELEGVLKILAEYPRTPADEMSAFTMRRIARAALQKGGAE